MHALNTPPLLALGMPSILVVSYAIFRSRGRTSPAERLIPLLKRRVYLRAQLIKML